MHAAEWGQEPMKFVASALLLVILVIGAIAAYAVFIAYPRPIDHLIIASGGSDGVYDNLAKAYQKELETYGLTVELKPDLEGFFSLKAMVVDNSAEAGFVKGGFVGGQEGRLASTDDRAWHEKDVGTLHSVGRLFLEPLWVFTRASDTIASLRELKGKKILIGTKASGVRKISAHLLKASGLDATNSTLIEQDLPADGAPLAHGDADAAILVLPPESETVQKLLRNPTLHLMNFALEADAYVNRFSYLTKVVLHQGAVELNPDIPSADLTLLATQPALVLRKDVNPSVATLLTYAVFNNPKSGSDRNGDPILFYRPGEFPSGNDPEFELAPEAKAYLSTHELPFLLRELGPLNARLGLPFALTAFASEHGNQALLLLIPLLSILIPSARIAPALYTWAGQRRLLYWYRRLKALERRLLLERSADLQGGEAKRELESIDTAVAHMRVPLAFSSQLYDLRMHINLVRQRLESQLEQIPSREAANGHVADWTATTY
jgi:uncharacterized protein